MFYKHVFFSTLFILLVPCLSFSSQNGRYFYQGDGKISFLNLHTKKKINVEYRQANGQYDPQAIDQLNQIFNVPKKELAEDVSLRLISLLDYLGDKFSPGKTLQLKSVYRSPSYNQSLRDKGKVAAKTSYHMEAMATDVIFPGADPQKIWEFARHLDYGGVGHYGGPALHIDSGRPRFWTQKTALPKEDKPQENKNVYLSIDKDIYWAGETLQLFLSGISDYPFGIKAEFELIENTSTKKITSFIPQFYQWYEPRNLHRSSPEPTSVGDKQGNNISGNECVPIQNRLEARQIYWKIPEKITHLDQKLAVQIEFCDHHYSQMPKMITSRPFLIRIKDLPY